MQLCEMWVDEDLYEMIDDYLIAIGRGGDEVRFQSLKRNFELKMVVSKNHWDAEACNRMIEHMINTVYEIN